jgi:phenylalanyl-tRNA synthetase beta chain
LKAGAAPGMHATRSAQVIVAGQSRGHVGEVDPTVLENYGVKGRVAWIELDLGALLSGPFGNRTYSPVSKYPSSDVDLAFEVSDDIAAAQVEGALRKGGAPLLQRVELFDVYRGEGLPAGTRSLAYRLRFQAPDRTLTDAEVAAARQACIDAVEKQRNATLRG